MAQKAADAATRRNRWVRAAQTDDGHTTDGARSDIGKAPVVSPPARPPSADAPSFGAAQRPFGHDRRPCTHRSGGAGARTAASVVTLATRSAAATAVTAMRVRR